MIMLAHSLNSDALAAQDTVAPERTEILLASTRNITRELFYVVTLRLVIGNTADSD